VIATKQVQSLRDPARKPTHPGEILREDVLPALRMTQAAFAERLGVSRLTVSEILNEKRRVTPDMAIRLGRLLGNGPRLDVWQLEQERDYKDIQPLEVEAL
jgi:antitoxin HigA-1